jgi:predicted DNA repair protein MutK
MATSLLALLDDITTLLDDLAMLAKVAARKTAGVVGDDLALNAQQVSGLQADRELPVVWGVAKGSFRNKAILVPAALAISAFAPWAITPLLMLGGAYLCYEGVEKLASPWLHGLEDASTPGPQRTNTAADTLRDLRALEQARIRGAVRTDFVLSTEIITITLGTVQQSPLLAQVIVMSGVAALMTVGVYGLVAVIVKLDDAGLYLSRQRGARAAMGRGILAAAPWFLRALSVAGTAAMFLVGGGILTHGVNALHSGIEQMAAATAVWPGGELWKAVARALLNVAFGVGVGVAVLASVVLAGRLRR